MGKRAACACCNPCRPPSHSRTCLTTRPPAQAMALHGRKWSQVAKLVPGRTDVQCRERFMNALNPGAWVRGVVGGWAVVAGWACVPGAPGAMLRQALKHCPCCWPTAPANACCAPARPSAPAPRADGLHALEPAGGPGAAGAGAGASAGAACAQDTWGWAGGAGRALLQQSLAAACTAGSHTHSCSLAGPLQSPPALLAPLRARRIMAACAGRRWQRSCLAAPTSSALRG